MMMRVWLELARISNLPTVWTNVLAGWVLAGGEWAWGQLGWLLAGASLLYTGGMFLNDAADARWDRAHRAERPIAEGRVSEKVVWAVAVGFLFAGLGLVLIGGANGWVSVGLLVAIVGYDLYHKQWKGSVVVMGLCRVLLYLAAGSAVAGGWDWVGNGELVLKALALGGYVVGVSLVARGEANLKQDTYYDRVAGFVAMGLPILVAVALMWAEWQIWILGLVWLVTMGVFEAVEAGRWRNRDEEDLQFLEEKEKAKSWSFPWGMVFTGLFVILPFLSVMFRTTEERRIQSVQWLTVIGVAVLLFQIVKVALRWMRRRPPSNIGRAVGLLLAAITVVDALAVVRLNPWLAVSFVVLTPLLRLWQRKIAAT